MTERIPIADIMIGQRRRQDLGDIPALAKNINAHGLLHPIIIAADNELIAGERRLRAHQHLGLDAILVRRWPDLTEDERRELELAENLDRKDLTPYERSRNVVALAEVASEVLAEPAKTASSKGGRPPKAAVAEAVVAERINIPRETIRDARQHVTAVDEFPELIHYSKTDAIKIASSYKTLPPERLAEARAAVMAHNGPVLAELTGRPPLPKSPTPHQQAATDPAVRFQTDLHDLWKRLNGVRDHGGIGVLVKNWGQERQQRLLVEVRLIRRLMDEWEREIEEVVQ